MQTRPHPIPFPSRPGAPRPGDLVREASLTVAVCLTAALAARLLLAGLGLA